MSEPRLLTAEEIWLREAEIARAGGMEDRAQFAEWMALRGWENDAAPKAIESQPESEAVTDPIRGESPEGS